MKRMIIRKHVQRGLVTISMLGMLATPLSGQAFTFGSMNVISAIEQPFKAELDILSLRPNEKELLDVRLATAEEFEKNGLNYNRLPAPLNFSLIEHNGQTKVLITSKQAINTPSLALLITASAGDSNKLTRQYTVSLTPAKQSPPTVAMSTTTASTLSRKSYGPIRRNESLWSIATASRPNNSISVYQVAISLVNANPKAFEANNVNGMKTGYMLRIPDEPEMRQISARDAERIFAEHNITWKTRNSVIKQPVKESNLLTTNMETVVFDVAESKSVEVDQSFSALVSEGYRPQLTEVKEKHLSEEHTGLNAEDIRQLTEQLIQLQETIEAQTLENSDLKAYINDIEEQLGSLYQLMPSPDDDVIVLQEVSEQGGFSSVNALADESGLTGEVVVSNDFIMQSDVIPANETNNNPENDPNEMIVSEQIESDAEGVEESLISEAGLRARREWTQFEQWVAKQDIPLLAEQSKLFISEYKLPVAAGGLASLLLLFFILRRRSKHVEPVASLSEQSSADINVNATSVEIATDTAVSTETEEDKTIEELLEQADMFIGYADYIQAQLVLEQASKLEPDNVSVAYKNLFVLFKRKQAGKFLNTVEQIGFSELHEKWNEIRQWGHELMPDVMLFTPDQVSDDGHFIPDLAIEFPSFDNLSGSEVELDIAELDEFDEAETKLELAAAYIDMDDGEVARKMLQEVLETGAVEQRSRAQALFDKL